MIIFTLQKAFDMIEFLNVIHRNRNYFYDLRHVRIFYESGL